MADVFISYSRRDQAFALQLVGALTQRGYTAWLDQTDVFPAGAFREDIQAGIEEAGAFLFLLSPDSAVSEECRKELDYAVSVGKKLIPVLQREVSPDLVPMPLRDLDWVTDVSFDQLVEKVLVSLLTDKDDWNRSGRWQRLSREWDKNHKQHSGLLLHGKELKRAEGWLKHAERWRLEGSRKKPQPDPGQIQFIGESRRAANRFLLARVLVLFLLVGLTAGGAFWFLYHDPTLVTTLNNDGVGSLRWAIDLAPSGKTITFASSLVGQTIALTDTLQIPNKQLRIQGPDTGGITLRNARHSIAVDDGASITIINLTFLGGTANPTPLFDNRGTLILTNSTLSGNSAPVGQSGGRGVLNTGTLTLTNSTISGNSALDDEGGGIFNTGIVTLTNSIVSGNFAFDAGGILNEYGTVTLTNSTISGNSSSGDGGGIGNTGTVTLTNSTVSGNSSSSGGGGGVFNTGISTPTSGVLILTNSTVSDNSSSGDGGGIENTRTVTLTNSTVSGNTSSSGNGGGIDNDGGIVMMVFCTLYGNTASKGGGFSTEDFVNSYTQPQQTYYGQTTMSNSLVAGNQASTGPDVAGKLTTEGYNLLQNTAGTTFLDPDHKHSSDLTNIPLSDIKIDSSLQLNGSKTSRTHALLPSSPAIGVIPLPFCQIKEIYDEHVRMYVDQRGMKRPDENESTCDIGAYEQAG